MYTDMKDTHYVYVDMQSLVLAYEYAGKQKNEKMSKQLAKHITTMSEEKVHIEKDSELYQFLRSCPMLEEDKITWDMIGQALLISCYQKNRGPRGELIELVSLWDDYVKENKENEGLQYRLTQLSKSTRHYILKYNDVECYQQEKRKKYQEVYTFPQQKDVKSDIQEKEMKKIIQKKVA